MKKKIVYMLAFICCMSFFSAAKQARKNCNKISAYSMLQKCKKPLTKETQGGIGIDLSPLNFFLGNI